MSRSIWILDVDAEGDFTVEHLFDGRRSSFRKLRLLNHKPNAEPFGLIENAGRNDIPVQITPEAQRAMEDIDAV